MLLVGRTEVAIRMEGDDAQRLIAGVEAVGGVGRDDEGETGAERVAPLWCGAFAAAGEDESGAE